MAASQSDFDILLDKPWIDFFRELDRIRSGEKAVKNSPLYRFAQRSDKERMDNTVTTNESTDILEDVYQSQNAFSVLDDLPNRNNFEFYFKNCLEISSAKANRLWDDLKYCVSDSGTYSDFNAVIQLYWKRFHKRFQIRDFLFCQIDHDNSQSPSFPELYNQFVASRLNYILNGNYLPILGGISSDDHHTAFIIYPSDEVSSSSSSPKHTNWCFIHINSNGDPANFNLVDLLYHAFDQYKVYLSNQEENVTTSSTSMCWENIQQQHGTCGNWGIILTFVLFRHICEVSTSFIENSGGVDKIEAICQKIRKKMTNPTTMQRMNDLIADLKLSIQYLIVETFEKLENAKRHVEITTTDVYREILHGRVDGTVVELDEKIFKIMCNVHRYVHKNLDRVAPDENKSMVVQKYYPAAASTSDENAAASTPDYETDSETHDELQRNRWINQVNEIENMERPANELQIFKSLNLFRKRFASGHEISAVDLEKVYSIVTKLQVKPPNAMFRKIVRRFFIYLYADQRDEIIENLVSLKNRLRAFEKEIANLQEKVDEDEDGDGDIDDDNDSKGARVNSQSTVDLLIQMMKERDELDQTIHTYTKKLFQLDVAHLEREVDKFDQFTLKIQKLHKKYMDEPVLTRSSLKRKTYDLD